MSALMYGSSEDACANGATASDSSIVATTPQIGHNQYFVFRLFMAPLCLTTSLRGAAPRRVPLEAYVRHALVLFILSSTFDTGVSRSQFVLCEKD